VRFPSSDYLFLDYTSNDPLFWWSASGQSPLLFQNFRGTTDVAGVILNPAGPTVTNTHWFVL
jgi:hypothetical protein